MISNPRKTDPRRFWSVSGEISPARPATRNLEGRFRYSYGTKNRVVSGIVGHAFGGWLYVSHIWVEESFRNKGNGAKLLKTIENEAVKPRCKHTHLDTYNFEARPFYEKHDHSIVCDA